MSRWRVFVTRFVYEEARQLLAPAVDVTYHDSRDGLSGADLREALPGHDAMICQLTDAIDADVLAAGTDLKIVANVAVGYDNIDVETAKARGIVVTNTPGVLTESTADLTFALILACARRVPEAERFLRRGDWRQWEIDLLSGRDVHGATLGIVGMGRIGRAVARRAAGFGMRVLYHARRGVDPQVETDLAIERCSFQDLLTESDFVSLHVPLTGETRDLIGRDELARMRDTAFLINTARGAVVDEDALVEALREDRIGGAGLDVFRTEPDCDARLLAFENVVALPHIASATVATRTRMCVMAAENVLAMTRGEAPPNPV